jgi:selenium metabolism protein YedF
MVMEKEIDARGLACPQPVLLTKKELDEGREGTFRVLVDSEVARENVKRFAESEGCSVQVRQEGDRFEVRVAKGSVAENEEAKRHGAVVGDEVVLICTDVLGKGDARLGAILMKAFLNALVDADPAPKKLMFLNEGVRLTTAGSEVLDVLGEFQRRGVGLFSCGTCLEYYQLKDALKVGEVTNMFEIVKSLSHAAKVIGL